LLVFILNTISKSILLEISLKRKKIFGKIKRGAKLMKENQPEVVILVPGPVKLLKNQKITNPTKPIKNSGHFRKVLKYGNGFLSLQTLSCCYIKHSSCLS